MGTNSGTGYGLCERVALSALVSCPFNPGTSLAARTVWCLHVCTVPSERGNWQLCWAKTVHGFRPFFGFHLIHLRVGTGGTKIMMIGGMLQKVEFFVSKKLVCKNTHERKK